MNIRISCDTVVTDIENLIKIIAQNGEGQLVDFMVKLIPLAKNRYAEEMLDDGYVSWRCADIIDDTKTSYGRMLIVIIGAPDKEAYSRTMDIMYKFLYSLQRPA